MIITTDEDKDVIEIDLEELFGKVIELSAKDADRLNLEEGVKILVLEPRDGPIFLSLVDMVVMDVTGRLANNLADDGIEATQTELEVSITKDSINQEGLRIINEALQVALTSGVLSYYQSGMPGYQIVEEANKRKYQHALNTIAAAQAYRMASYQRPRITQRDIN